MNNHKKAKAYILKSSLIGNGVDVEYGGLDSVKLKGIKYDSDGEFIVPEFITDIEEGCFYGKNYSKIVINNSKYRKFDASRLCVGMESNILDVKFNLNIGEKR